MPNHGGLAGVQGPPARGGWEALPPPSEAQHPPNQATRGQTSANGVFSQLRGFADSKIQSGSSERVPLRHLLVVFGSLRCHPPSCPADPLHSKGGCLLGSAEEDVSQNAELRERRHGPLTPPSRVNARLGKTTRSGWLRPDSRRAFRDLVPSRGVNRGLRNAHRLPCDQS